MKKLCAYVAILIVSIASNKNYGCTTFVISGKHTPDGKPLLFKNRDTDEMQNSLVFFSDGKYRYIGLVDGNKDWDRMVWGGYNEAGFAIINSAAYNNNIGDTTSFKDQEGVVMKLALQTCKTLKDFEELLALLPKPMGLDANFGVIDASGGAAYYETGNYRYVKYDANDPETAADGILIRTNHSLSADLTKGYGFCRYKTATEALRKALSENNLTPRYLFNNLSRNLYHSLTKNDLSVKMPSSKSIPDYRFFIDYIPRESTASAIMIVGAKDEAHIKDIMMWTILGFPLTSVAVPTWISAGENLPRVVSMDSTFKSPVCSAALKFKEECFPIKYDRGYNYINLSAVINRERNGYMQLLKPVEDKVFEKTMAIAREFEEGKKTARDLQDFYLWLDNYLDEAYMKLFSFKLLNQQDHFVTAAKNRVEN